MSGQYSVFACLSVICRRYITARVRYHFADISSVVQERISLKKTSPETFFSRAARRGTRLSGRLILRKRQAFGRTAGYRLRAGPLPRFHLLSRFGARLNKFSSLGARKPPPRFARRRLCLAYARPTLASLASRLVAVAPRPSSKKTRRTLHRPPRIILKIFIIPYQGNDA